MPSLAALVTLCSSFFACIYATPVPQDAQPGTANYTATFESYNSTTQEFQSIPHIPGPYDALYWSVFEQGPFDYQAGLCAYVCPASFPAEAAFGKDYNPGPASISSAYDGSDVQHFTLTDFYFGCTAVTNFTVKDEVITTNSPATCTLTVLGFRNAQGSSYGVGAYPDAQTTFEYTPEIGENLYTSAPYAPMMHVVMPESFGDMRTVTFNSTVDKTVYLSDPTTLMDNVSYTVTIA